MSTTTKTKITSKDLQKKVTAWIEELIEKSESMTDDEFKKIMQSFNLYHHYSFSNTLLIFFAGANKVRGYKAWQRVNRQVKRAEKGIAIIAPNFKKLVEENESGEETERVLKYFKVAHVFDISQTELIGEEVEEKCIQGISREKLEESAKQLGIDLNYEILFGNTKGYAKNGNIVRIEETDSIKEQITSYFHEGAHVLLKHNDKEVRKNKPRAQREFEAETTAFLVAQYFGIDTHLESAVYIKSWFPASKVEVIEKSFSEIFETIKKIIESVELI